MGCYALLNVLSKKKAFMLRKDSPPASTLATDSAIRAWLLTLTEECETNDAAVDQVSRDLVELPLELAHEFIGIAGSVAELMAHVSRNGLHQLW